MRMVVGIHLGYLCVCKVVCVISGGCTESENDYPEKDKNLSNIEMSQ